MAGQPSERRPPRTNLSPLCVPVGAPSVHRWLSPGQELSQVMGRTSKDMARKGPILLASWKNKNSFEKHRMMRMSLKKLRKIGDPEKLLHRAVLINNTLDCIRNGGMACRKESSINTYVASNYSTEEEQILSSIHLPPPITPISDQPFDVEIYEEFDEENFKNKEDIADNSDGDTDGQMLGLVAKTSAEGVLPKIENYYRTCDSLTEREGRNVINSTIHRKPILYNSKNNLCCIIAG